MAADCRPGCVATETAGLALRAAAACRAHLYHEKVVGIMVQMLHNGAADCCSLHLRPGQLGSPSFTRNNRAHLGIKEEDYLSSLHYFTAFVFGIVFKIKK